MIYTLGYTPSYSEYFRTQARPRKAKGGSVWKTKDEAEAYRLSMASGAEFTVYGLMADWNKDTQPDPDGEGWHELIHGADLVELSR